MPTSSATSRTVKRRFPRISTKSLDMVVVCWCGRSSRPGIFTDRYSALFKTLKPLTALRSAHKVLPLCLVKQMKCLCKIFAKFAAKFHTQTRCSSSSFIVTLLLIRRRACAPAQFSGCSSMANAHSETGQMAVYRQNLTLGAPSSRSALSVLVGALFKKFGLFLNTPRITITMYDLLTAEPAGSECSNTVPNTNTIHSNLLLRKLTSLVATLTSHSQSFPPEQLH